VMTAKKAKLICMCNGVSDKDILSILKRGARDLGEVKKFTLATAGCGRCKGETEAIIHHYLSGKAPDSQQRLNFKNRISG
jgi:NAD(P)H-nitrite reductase large subunit